MQIRVDMAFSYGKQHFGCDIHECNDVNILRHMKRCGYGEVISSEIKADTVAPEIEKEETVEVEPVKKAPVKRAIKKAAKK